MNNLRAVFVCLLFVCSAAAEAQTLTIYDEALQNSFEDFSYGGGGDFASTAEAHDGTNSVSFIGNSFNALSFARPAPDVSSATYPVLRFWVHGGATGNQQLRLYLQLDEAIVANVELDAYIQSGSIGAGVWREVTVPLTPLAATFDRIDLQSDQGPRAGRAVVLCRSVHASPRILSGQNRNDHMWERNDRILDWFSGRTLSCAKAASICPAPNRVSTQRNEGANHEHAEEQVSSHDGSIACRRGPCVRARRERWRRRRRRVERKGNVDGWPFRGRDGRRRFGSGRRFP